MPEFPETSESLIAGVRDPSNRAAWDQFEQLYRPYLVMPFARGPSLQKRIDEGGPLSVTEVLRIGRRSRPGSWQLMNRGLCIATSSQPTFC
jgi:hypothetical protein